MSHRDYRVAMLHRSGQMRFSACFDWFTALRVVRAIKQNDLDCTIIVDHRSLRRMLRDEPQRLIRELSHAPCAAPASINLAVSAPAPEKPAPNNLAEAAANFVSQVFEFLGVPLTPGYGASPETPPPPPVAEAACEPPEEEERRA